MKKYLLILIASLVAVSCTKEDAPKTNEEPTPVSISLDYTFSSGSMVKSPESDYMELYNTLIATKKITTDNFNLEFKEKNTGVKYNFKGKWSKGDKIEILPGSYEVTGKSVPEVKTVDTLSITFNETVTITNTTTSVNLSAKNGSYLLLFGSNDIQSIQYKSVSTEYISGTYTKMLECYNNKLYYMFIRSLPYPTSNIITITKQSGGTAKIDINDNSFEIGKYYYFNALANSFSVPPMEAGN